MISQKMQFIILLSVVPRILIISAGGWFDYQYFSDSHFDSGADTYICTKDCGSIYWIDGMWFVDSESAVGICDDLMVELQYLSWIGLTYGAVFIFIGKF